MNKLQAWRMGIFERTHKEDFRTPQYIVNWLKFEFGDHFYDACYNENFDNALSTPYIPNKTDLDVRNWVYFNPPFHSNKLEYFISLAEDLHCKGNDVVFLLPNKLCQVRYNDLLNGFFDEIIFLSGRIDFNSIYSVKGGSSRNGCFIGYKKGIQYRKTIPTFRFVKLKDIKKGFNL